MRFLASEIRASTAEGCIVVSWTRSSRIAALTALSWSEASQMLKRFGRPSAWPCSRRTRAQNAWKVPTVISRAFSPASCGDALAHLARGLVREGHGEDARRVHPARERGRRCAS